MDVPELLNQIRENRSEEAFGTVMRGFTGLVYSVALRRLQNRALAEECTQEVFLRFARKAPRLQNEAELVGWLHATAHRVAVDRWRAEARRGLREQKASLMSAPIEPTDPHWKEIAPMLDDALNELGPTDRQAVLLRYFQSASIRTVGTALGLSEDAARMRVRRALERLHALLVRRGVTCSVAAFAILLQERSTEATMPGLGAPGDAARILSQAGRPTAALVRTGVILMKAKTLFVCLAGLIALWWWLQRQPTSPAGLGGTPPRGGVESRDGTRAVVASFRRARPGGSTPAEPAEIQDRLSRLRDILRGARRVRSYPPKTLGEAVWRCADIANETAGVLAEALTSPDYETRHWAFSGLQLLLEDSAAKAGHETARLALARLAASATQSEELRTPVLMALLGPGSRVHAGEGLAYEPVSPEVLAILTASFQTKGIDAVHHNVSLANMLNPALQATGQDTSDYRRQLLQLLKTGDEHQRLGAAYALSGLSGEKPADVKATLVQALSSDSRLSPAVNAAHALGQFGADAKDALPALLRYHGELEPSGSVRQVVEQALVAIDPDLSSRFPSATTRNSAPERQGEESSETRSLSVQVLDPVLETARDPARRAELLETWWLQTAARYVEPLRNAFVEQASKESDPAVSEVLTRLADNISPLFGTEESVSVEERLPDLGELLSRALSIAQTREYGIPAGTEERVKQLQAKYGPGLFGAQTTTPDALRRMAADLRAIDGGLYREALRSLLEYHPDLDRIFQ